MGIARSITQAFLKSPVLPATAIVGGWLRLDRLYESSSRWARRSSVRRLTPLEIQEAERVFGNSIPYEDVRVVEESSLARRIAALSGRVHLPQGERLAVTVFKTIHFTTKLGSEGQDMPWLVHELTHVWQYCQRGTRYLSDALQAQARHGEGAYDFEKGLEEGWSWEEFNLEQQGDIARAYYRALLAGRAVNVYEPYVNVLRSATSKR